MTYLDGAGRANLRAELALVPGIVDDLENVKAGTAKLARPVGGSRPRPGSKMPLHLGAVEASDLLKGTLAGWVAYTINTRGGDWPANTTVSLSVWLDRNAERLGMCEGSVDALDEIRYAIGECWRVVDIPPEDPVRVDPTLINEADRMTVTRQAIEAVTERMGERVNNRRLRRLVAAGLVTPIGKDGKEFLYRLGDVLVAHRLMEQRNREAS